MYNTISNPRMYEDTYHHVLYTYIFIILYSEITAYKRGPIQAGMSHM